MAYVQAKLSDIQVDVAEYVPFDETDPDDFDRVLSINTKGPFLVTRAVAGVMKSQDQTKVNLGRHGIRDIGRGSIVNVSSAMALVAVSAKAPYTTSKHALTGVTKAAGMWYLILLYERSPAANYLVQLWISNRQEFV